MSPIIGDKKFRISLPPWQALHYKKMYEYILQGAEYFEPKGDETLESTETKGKYLIQYMVGNCGRQLCYSLYHQ